MATLQPTPASSQQHRPHFQPSNALPPEVRPGDLPPITKEELERAAAFTRLLANADFALAVGYLQDDALQALTNAQKDKPLREAKGAWRFALSIGATLRADAQATENKQRERAEIIANQKAGTTAAVLP